MLWEYDSVIKDQVSQGIVKRVEESLGDIFLIFSTRYIVYHIMPSFDLTRKLPRFTLFMMPQHSCLGHPSMTTRGFFTSCWGFVYTEKAFLMIKPNLLQSRFTRIVVDVSSTHAFECYHKTPFRVVQRGLPKSSEEVLEGSLCWCNITGTDSVKADQLFTRSKEILKQKGFEVWKLLLQM